MSFPPCNVVHDGVFYNGAAIDGLIYELETAYVDLDTCYQALELAEGNAAVIRKRMAECGKKIKELREKLNVVYPATKTMPLDWAISSAKEFRQYNKEHGL